MRQKFNHLTILALILSLGACIGDDVIFDTVEEQVRIMSNIDTLGFGETYQFEAIFLNNIGAEEETTIDWTSSDPSILSIDDTGLAQALESGSVSVYATVDLIEKVVRDTIDIVIGENTVIAEVTRSGQIQTTTFYDLEGTFLIEETDNGILITFEEDYFASDGLPGLFVYLTNNPSSANGAHEIGAVEVFKGAHTYE
ncbi:MAG: Ig-like domain-containing protein, partial [Bacteroidota bacterium]